MHVPLLAFRMDAAVDLHTIVVSMFRSSPGAKYEIIAEHHSPHGPSVTQIRGSLIASSLETLRQVKLFDRYLECLPAEHHDDILYVLASSWVPIDTAMAHYGACDAMELSEAELSEIGGHVSQRLVSTFLGTLMRSARVIAAPTHVPLRQYPKLWDRLLYGGGCSVSALGIKDARIESRGVPMFRYRYFRIAYTGLIRGAGLVFRPAMHARIRHSTDSTMTIDLSWV